MKLHEKSLFIVALTMCFLAGMASQSFGEQEIDLGDLNTSAPATAAAPKPAPTVAPAPVATPTPVSQEIEMEENTQPATQTAPQPTPTVFEVHGHVKMKDLYQSGIGHYKEKDYDLAIKDLTSAVRMKDPYTQKFYYAEAYAMLGVIYQYHIIHYGHAYRCYAEALKYERNNPTAKRHIKQVYKYRHRKD